MTGLDRAQGQRTFTRSTLVNCELSSPIARSSVVTSIRLGNGFPFTDPGSAAKCYGSDVHTCLRLIGALAADDGRKQTYDCSHNSDYSP